MARDRQRAKQRQADRRAKRLAEEHGPGEATPQHLARARGREEPDGAGAADLAATPPDRDGEPDPRLAVGAPPEEIGRSDAVLEDEPELDGDEDLAEEELAEEDLDGDEAPDEGYAPRGRRGGADAAGQAAASDRPRVLQFLVNVWAELQRVQWPNRQQMITLTWVVLGFVLIAGGYLGLLDAIFSRIIQGIL